MPRKPWAPKDDAGAKEEASRLYERLRTSRMIAADLTAMHWREIDDALSAEGSSSAYGFQDAEHVDRNDPDGNQTAAIGAANIISLSSWKPKQSGNIASKAAAGGFSDTTVLEIPNGTTVELMVLWTASTFELMWTVSGNPVKGRLLIQFFEADTGALLGSIHDLGELDFGDHHWTPSIDELGFLPSAKWAILPSIANPKLSSDGD